VPKPFFVGLVVILLSMGWFTPSVTSPQSSVTQSVKSRVRCLGLPYSKELPQGPACEKELFARWGHPFMFPVHDGIASGVSSGPDRPSTLVRWVENQTDKPVELFSCCNSTFFDSIDVFDSTGHRVLSKTDLAVQKAHEEGREMLEVCTCSGTSIVQPHTIQIVDSVEISVRYNLQPGRYIISERNNLAIDYPIVNGQGSGPQPPHGFVLEVK
jgi:hypothetical protein